MKPAYYNEIDPFAAQWLRNLISAGLIAPGDVDERSIEDVHPSDLKPYAQCHFFAGIGVWSYALRRAGWPDDKHVWTGSCPCQPFSTAGKGTGFADERHLWPAWNHLIDECRPAIIFGEQVASKDAEPWIDLVQADLEAMDYAFGCVPFPSAGVGAPHVRDRLYWVAQSEHGRREARQPEWDWPSPALPPSATRGLADLHGDGREPRGEGGTPVGHRTASEPNRGAGRLEHPGSAGLAQRERIPGVPGGETGAGQGQASERAGIRDVARPGPVNGFWRDADWLLCRDGRWRPVGPGTFPLAHGSPARVGRLRAYGNAINAEAAKVFVEVVMDWLGYGDL